MLMNGGTQGGTFITIKALMRTERGNGWAMTVHPPLTGATGLRVTHKGFTQRYSKMMTHTLNTMRGHITLNTMRGHIIRGRATQVWTNPAVTTSPTTVPATRPSTTAAAPILPAAPRQEDGLSQGWREKLHIMMMRTMYGLGKGLHQKNREMLCFLRRGGNRDRLPKARIRERRTSWQCHYQRPPDQWSHCGSTAAC